MSEKEIEMSTAVDEEFRKPSSFRPKFLKELNLRAKKRSETLKRKLNNSKLTNFVTQTMYAQRSVLGAHRSRMMSGNQRKKNNNDSDLNTCSISRSESYFAAQIIEGQKDENGRLHGKVSINFKDGCIFEGTYDHGIRSSGQLFYPMGIKYEGGFLGNRFEGTGKLSYLHGRVIEGEWNISKLIGNAKITYPNGDVYYGPVDDKNRKHGDGYIFLANNYKYIGSFANGSITGYGAYYKDDNLITRGYWKKGKLIVQDIVLTHTGQVLDSELKFNAQSINSEIDNSENMLLE